MPRKADKHERVRKTVEVSLEIEAALEKMAEERGITMTQVLRQACLNLITQEERRKAGMTIGAIEEKDGQPDKIYVYDW